MQKPIVSRGAIFGAFFLLACTFICAGQDEFPVLKGDYLGQKPPGVTPEIFAPDILSTDKTELGCSFSPDGKEVFFTEWNVGKNTLMTMKQKNDRWTRRAMALFSGDFSDVDPYFSSDGKRLYFSSSRPLEKGGEPKDSDIWYAEKTEDGAWGNPVHLGNPNTAGKDDYYTPLLVHCITDHTGDAHGGQREGKQAECAQEHRAHTSGHENLVHQVLHGTQHARGHVDVEGLQRRVDLWEEPLRIRGGTRGDGEEGACSLTWRLG